SAQSPLFVQPIAQMPLKQNWPEGHGLALLHGARSPLSFEALPVWLVSADVSVMSPSEPLQAARQSAAKVERSRVFVIVMASLFPVLLSLRHRDDAFSWRAAPELPHHHKGEPP